MWLQGSQGALPCAALPPIFSSSPDGRQLLHCQLSWKSSPHPYFSSTGIALLAGLQIMQMGRSRGRGPTAQPIIEGLPAFRAAASAWRKNSAWRYPCSCRGTQTQPKDYKINIHVGVCKSAVHMSPKHVRKQIGGIGSHKEMLWQA